MCGIAGIIHANHNNITQQGLKAMTDIIAHRGPDGDGHWISSNGNVGLGHRRLSIIDLSHEADQPMHYMDRYTIAFNGEIYNYIELKETLVKKGFSFRTQSDTEVLMALYHELREECLQLLDGMFSFVIYDSHHNSAFAARDRFGEKPFYFSYMPGKYFYFGSEMKCLWAAGINKSVDNVMLYNYINSGYIHNPADMTQTFYENCTMLQHAHYINIDCKTLLASVKQYYSLEHKNLNITISEKEAEEKFSELFYTSVTRRLRSDVPVGSSLSGGLDSSLVVCVIDQLKKGTAQQQETFSAVFPGFAKDERKYMDYVIAKTNVHPNFVTPNDSDMVRDLEKLNFHQEEPYGSASIYVQYRVMQMAKEKNVTVLLDGQGADEILAGYHPYYNNYFNELKRTQPEKYLEEYNAYVALQGGSNINPPSLLKQSALKHTVKKMAGSYWGSVKKMHNAYKQLKSPTLNKDFRKSYSHALFNDTFVPNSLNEVLYYSTFVNGLQDLLRYADRNSMAHSREVRLPFLNHELIEFLFTLPPNFKIKNGWTKSLMRNSFKDLLPKEIAWRTDKIGYEPPQKSWMESAVMQEKIQEAKETLINKNIIPKKAKEKGINANAAAAGNNLDWIHFMAGSLFK